MAINLGPNDFTERIENGYKFLAQLSDNTLKDMISECYTVLSNTIEQDRYPSDTDAMCCAINMLCKEAEKRFGKIEHEGISTFLFNERELDVDKLYIAEMEAELFSAMKTYGIGAEGYNSPYSQLAKFSEWRAGEDYQLSHFDDEEEEELNVTCCCDKIKRLPGKKEPQKIEYYSEDLERYTFKDLEEAARRYNYWETKVPSMCALLQCSGAYMNPKYLIEKTFDGDKVASKLLLSNLLDKVNTK